MADKHSPYLQAQEVPEEYSILIIGENSPLLVDALSDVLTVQGGTVYTHGKKGLSVDYLIIIDSHSKLDTSLRLLKSGGKVLHVLSHEMIGNVDVENVSVFTLPLNKTYKSSVLINKILSNLFASKPYVPVQTKKPPKKLDVTKLSLPAAQKRKRVIRFISISTGILLIVFSPFIVWMVATTVSVRALSQLRDPALDSPARAQKAETAQTASYIAEHAAKPLLPLIALVSPETGTIVSEHMTILSSVTDTVSLATEQTELLEPIAQAITSGNTQHIEDDISQVQQSLTALSSHIQPAVTAISTLHQYKEHPLVKPAWPYYEQIEEADRLLSKGNVFMETIPDLMAFKTRKKYLVLLQNNFELRPTGGFIGSFAIITMENGSMVELAIEDIYEADGQLKGQVDPPDALKEYLNQPNWFMRDSNWNPDFALSAKQAEWFLQKELNEQVNGVIAIDLYFLKNILQATGGVYVPDYQATVTADDFFHKLQSDTHDSFFPGSNKKRNLIDGLTNALLINISEQDPLTLLKIAKTAEESFEEKHILLTSHDTKVQETVEQLGWGGRIASHQDVLGAHSDTVADYIMIVDANLGVNKVNASIQREIFTMVEPAESTVERELIVYYNNTSTENTDSLYDGVYKNYLRVVLPREVFVHFVGINDTHRNILEQSDIESYGDKTSVGMFVEVPPQQDAKAIIRYSLPKPESDVYSYQLMIQKQPGTLADPFVFKLGTQAQSLVTQSNISSFPYLVRLDHDRLLTVDFKQ
ncbi:MAG: DUF4012 domain-containing protein [Candidatus Roizmanbacteria bacterium]|nr:DUF4012 domain-containing protein [Candidatus Roizmanbacteria bacterium]